MKLLTVVSAARLVGQSPELFRWRIERGDLPVARQHPTRVRYADVMAYVASGRAAVNRAYKGRVPNLLHAHDALAKLLNAATSPSPAQSVPVASSRRLVSQKGTGRRLTKVR